MLEMRFVTFFWSMHVDLILEPASQPQRSSLTTGSNNCLLLLLKVVLARCKSEQRAHMRAHPTSKLASVEVPRVQLRQPRVPTQTSQDLIGWVAARGFTLLYWRSRPTHPGRGLQGHARFLKSRDRDLQVLPTVVAAREVPPAPRALVRCHQVAAWEVAVRKVPYGFTGS